MNTYYNPVRTLQGYGVLEKLPALIMEAAPEAGRILLLVWDESLLKNENVKTAIAVHKDKIVPLCFPCSNPDVEQLFSLYEKTKDLNIGLVIAIGGGSTLDVGKSLCCLYGQKPASVEELRAGIANKAYTQPSCPWIGVPTTAGTGSEVTCWATVWDPRKNAKYSIDTPDNYAYAAIIDPALARSMPLALAVSSALDAVCHAAESYWAKATNPVSRGMALAAIRLILGHIDGLFSEQDSESAHEFMAQGSMLAGMAFSNTRTTACHSISYPLTMHYKIPHGVAVSLLLAPVLELNTSVVLDVPALLDACGAASPRELHGRILSLLQRAGIPASLRAWGAEAKDLPYLAAQSMTKGRADNNPVPLTIETVTAILNQIL